MTTERSPSASLHRRSGVETRTDADVATLVARLRNAGESCRMLDRDIARFFGHAVEHDGDDYYLDGVGPHDRPPPRVPNFTGSVDAALALVVSRGWYFDLFGQYFPYACNVYDAPGFGGKHLVGVSARTLPLAVCLAAVRAHAILRCEHQPPLPESRDETASQQPQAAP